MPAASALAAAADYLFLDAAIAIMPPFRYAITPPMPMPDIYYYCQSAPLLRFRQL